MSHADSEPLAVASAANSDRALPVEVEERIQAYSLEFHDPAADPVADPETIAAARETLRWFNARLIELAPGPIEQLVAWDLTRRRDWALHALINHGTAGWAKKVQLELTNQRPLAVCTGAGPYYFPTAIGPMITSTKGCYFVFEEKTNVAGKKWARLCPACRASGGHRQPIRDARRDLQAWAKNYATSRAASS